MLGIGIIIPVLPVIFYSSQALDLGIQSAGGTRWAFCLLMASYSAMLFIGAPILGALSDRYGRKRILQICIVGSFVGYALFALAIYTENLALLFVSRVIPGFFAGSLSVLFSAISDVSDPADRPKNFAFVGIAFGLGFIFGPIIGGNLSDPQNVSWFQVSTPFIFTSLLCILNFVFVQLYFYETLSAFKQTKISAWKGVQNIRRAFTSANLRTLFSISFLVTLGFAFFTQFFSVYMIQKFMLVPKQIGWIFGWVGFWIIVTQGFILRKLSPHVSSRQIVSVTLLGMSVSILFLVFSWNITCVLIANFFIAIFQGLNSPNLLSLVSKQANSDEQGEILGINQSMQALGQIIPPLIIGFYGDYLVSLPFVLAGLLIFVAWLIYLLFYFRKTT